MTTASKGMLRLAPYSPDLVWFGGDDAERFLNDLITREIGDMLVGESRRSLLLQPQGKLDHILWVYKDHDRFGLLTDQGRGDALASGLDRYRIRVEVDIVVEDLPVWLVAGSADGIDVGWPELPRSIVVGDKPDVEHMAEQEYRRFRIEAAEPLFGVDVDETTIPQESGLVQVSVDFDKGCFLGQELVARIESRGGLAPRSIQVLDVAGSVAPGGTLCLDGAEVATVTSVAGDIALASVKRGVEPGATLAGDSVEAVVRGQALDGRTGL